MATNSLIGRRTAVLGHGRFGMIPSAADYACDGVILLVPDEYVMIRNDRLLACYKFGNASVWEFNYELMSGAGRGAANSLPEKKLRVGWQGGVATSMKKNL
jgi:hypothetical protein